MTAFARQVSNLTSSQRISFLGTHITPCLSVCISWESITNPTSAQSRAGEWNWDYNGRRKRTRVSPDCSMPSPEVMLWSVLVDRLLIPLFECSRSVFHFTSGINNWGGDLHHGNTYIRTQQLHVHLFLFFSSACLWKCHLPAGITWHCVWDCEHVRAGFMYSCIWWRFYSAINLRMQCERLSVYVGVWWSRALVILSSQERPGFPHVKCSRSYFNIRPGLFGNTANAHTSTQKPIHFCSVRSKCKVNWFRSSGVIYPVY